MLRWKVVSSATIVTFSPGRPDSRAPAWYPLIKTDLKIHFRASFLSLTMSSSAYRNQVPCHMARASSGETPSTALNIVHSRSSLFLGLRDALVSEYEMTSNQPGYLGSWLPPRICILSDSSEKNIGIPEYPSVIQVTFERKC